MKNTILPIAIAGVWIGFSEFLRNEILFRNYWVEHFSSIGLKFETLQLNGILWMVWSFALAYLIFRLLQKFSLKEAVSLAWLPAFFMMWVAVYNLQVLPLKLLIIAVPLSLVEVAVAGIIIERMQGLKRIP